MRIRNEIKVGFVILVSLGLLYFGLNYLKGSDIFTKSRHYYALYDQIDGLNRDNVVMLNGVKVGRVSETILLPKQQNKILVRMEILEPELLIPDSSKAVIINLDLLGSKAINLEFSNRDTYHEEGDTLVAGIEKELKSVVEEKLAPLQSQIERLIEDTRALIAKAEEAMVTVNVALHKTESAIGTIEHTSASIDTLVSQETGPLRVTLNNIAAVTGNLRANTDKINEILANVASISDSLTRANYATAIQNATNALGQIDSLIARINAGEGSIGMLVNDPRLYDNLEQAAGEIDKLAEDLRVNPERYVHFSVFGKSEKPEDKPSKKDRKEQSR